MPSILLAILAVGAVPATTEPSRPGQEAESWSDEHGVWTALPDPDPLNILPPMPNFPQLPRSRTRTTFDRELSDAERRVDEALRRAEEAVARAGEAVRAAEDDR